MQNNIKIFRDGICGAGSLGGFFTMPGRDAIYGISNNHVLANLNSCAVGDAILRAGTNEQIATLSHWVPLSVMNANNTINVVDMALCKIMPGIPTTWQLDDSTLTKPAGYIEPRQFGVVYMKEENGSVRRGKITKSIINHVMQFDLCGKPYLFTKLIEIAPTDGQPFSQPGNSGSIILSSSHLIVGLLVGANSDSTKSYAVPFVDAILKFAPLEIL
jgi:hypothetical protein